MYQIFGLMVALGTPYKNRLTRKILYFWENSIFWIKTSEVFLLKSKLSFGLSKKKIDSIQNYQSGQSQIQSIFCNQRKMSLCNHILSRFMISTLQQLKLHLLLNLSPSWIKISPAYHTPILCHFYSMLISTQSKLHLQSRYFKHDFTLAS